MFFYLIETFCIVNVIKGANGLKVKNDLIETFCIVNLLAVCPFMLKLPI